MNWTKLIQDLAATGLTQAMIAKKCNTVQSNISPLLNIPGRCPNWNLGDSLIKLHKSRMNKVKGKKAQTWKPGLLKR